MTETLAQRLQDVISEWARDEHIQFNHEPRNLRTTTTISRSALLMLAERVSADAIKAQAAQIAERDAQIEALRADAERYRWLVGARTKEQASNEDVGAGVPLPQDELLETFASWYFDKEAADAAIDAAMAAKEPR